MYLSKKVRVPLIVIGWLATTLGFVFQMLTSSSNAIVKIIVITAWIAIGICVLIFFIGVEIGRKKAIRIDGQSPAYKQALKHYSKEEDQELKVTHDKPLLTDEKIQGVDKSLLIKENIVDFYLEVTSTRNLGPHFREELRKCEHDNEHVLNQKFMYTGIEEAYAWERLCGDPNYAPYDDSKRFFRLNMEKILDDIYTSETDVISFVSLGVGSGGKENIILTNILDRQNNLFFYPVDSSVQMLSLSLISFIENLDQYLKKGKIWFKGILGDFKDIGRELRAIHNSGSQKYLFALLGNTIGNDLESNLLIVYITGDLLLKV